MDNSTDPSDPSKGDVYVVGAEEPGASAEEHDVLYKYDPQSEKVIYKKTIFHSEGEELELEDIYGVAVDQSGTLWVYSEGEGKISAFSDAEANRWQLAADQRPRNRNEVRMPRAPGLCGRPR